MEELPIIINVILHLSITGVFYCLYQLVRNRAVYRIRIKWINNNDERWEKYTYDEMFDPNPSNLFGLKFPNEKHYN
jgi:hypothetical protein